MSDRSIPIAYVTKWATTAGIRIVRDAREADGGYLTERHGSYHLFVSKNHWTEDKSLAEARYRAAIDAARQAAERKVKKMEALYKAAPKYTEG